jgi:ferric-dicitrate binding protein FerR (iron transport regulator)
MTTHDDELAIERVLRAAGGRAQPSAQMQAQVRDAVHAQWREAVAQRRHRRQRVWFAAAASVAIVAVGVLLARMQFAAPAVVVASVSHSVGDVRSRAGRWDDWQPAPANRAVRDGDTVATGANGHAALALSDGVSLRLDHDTRIAFDSADHVEVLAGAIYVDSGIFAASVANRLQVHTLAGDVRHIGTQYEVKLVGAGTRVRVREGRVELTPDGARSVTVQAGEQATLSNSGALARERVPTNGSEWAWVLHAAPPFNIDGRRVREFLEWAGRELGREIVFQTPESEAEANRAVLSGSTAGLTPPEAIAAVLPTTRLRSHERGDQLVIALTP